MKSVEEQAVELLREAFASGVIDAQTLRDLGASDELIAALAS